MLARTVLADADLTGACFGRTLVAGCADLADARGLGLVVHHGPSHIDLETLRAAGARLPAAFLEGIGATGATVAASAG